MQPETMRPSNRAPIAVLGATGFIGSAIATEAALQGQPISAITSPRISTSADLTLDSDPLNIPEDVITALAAQLAGHDVVINAAGLSDARSESTSELYGANTMLPLCIALAAKRAGVRRMVHLSSAAVQGWTRLDETSRVAPFSPYSSSKAIAEKWLQQIDGIEISILRPTSVHGPGRRVTAQVAKVASSPLSSIAHPARPTPQTRVQTVAKSALFLATFTGTPPPITLTPDENLTTRSFLATLGSREPRRIPATAARTVIAIFNGMSPVSPRFAAYARRLDMLWFGQERESGWLDDRGLVPSHAGWRDLAEHLNRRQAPRVLFGVTSGASVRGFFRGQHRFLQSRGWDVYLTCNGDSNPEIFATEEGATYLPIMATRAPRPTKDLRTLASLLKVIIRVRPRVAVWGSPKIGLLGTIASRLTLTPSIYVIHGLRLETTHGLLRLVLRASERLATACASSVVVVGFELRDRVINLGLANPKKVTVLVSGSANGVSEATAGPSAPESEPIAGYVGRITADKGIRELITAWRGVIQSVPNAKLLIAGAVEEDPESKALARELAELPNTELLGHIGNVAEVYPRLRCLVLPSYREGLPNVVLEAAAHGVPSVVSDATGASESVVHGETGLVFTTGDANELHQHLLSVMKSGTTAVEMGSRARSHVLERYDQRTLWEAWHRHLRVIASRRSHAD